MVHHIPSHPAEPDGGRRLGIVLSGGGSRGAFQVGALKALIPYLEQKGPVRVVVGSSVGAINGIILGSWLGNGLPQAVETLESMWRERTFRNTFHGPPSAAFFRAIKVAITQYLNPGPRATSLSIFDPTPLMNRVDEMVSLGGGLRPEARPSFLDAVGVMTTVEGQERRGLLFVSARDELDPQVAEGASFDACRVQHMTAAHAFASAALPSVLPPVNLNLDTQQVRLVDGGIVDNIPVDPAVRLGASELVVVDNSGRKWWQDHFEQPHDTQDPWEVISKTNTFCIRPVDSFEVRNIKPFGPLLKEAVGRSRRDFIDALGPTWPIFKLLRSKLGEEVAYEVVSYCALHPQYMEAAMARGFEEATAALHRASAHHSTHEGTK